MVPLQQQNAQNRIAIIDDDRSVRSSLGMLLETHGWSSVEFERASDFLMLANPKDFHCIIIDFRMPGMSGVELLDEIQRRYVGNGYYVPPVIFLSGHGEVSVVVRTLKLGASDFLEKPVEPLILIDTVTKALKDDSIAREEHHKKTGISEKLSDLTAREREVLVEILKGYLSKQIAEHLNISTKTVETHRLHICQKFNVHTTMELASILRDNRFLNK